MNQSDLKKISEILEEVLALNPSKREKYLNELQIKEYIREEVLLLLSLEDKVKETFHSSAIDFTNDFFEKEEENPLVGKKIGIYKIKRELGYGGMGAVFLGERDDGKFSQEVAIKMLRREFNTERIRKYFTQEKEIQSKLFHPNIATLFDAGMTDEGIPYLVLEYVEGKKIDDYCDENNLKLYERLKLFNKVCDAVSFAHQNLVIHRDIKPSNIIITKEGEPKLLDFGISKLIDDSDETTKTITRIGAMTPEYASPEQIKGESVSTATDIYSLGVVLFKILTGRLPYSFSDKNNGKIFDEITNSQPILPSDAIKANPQSTIQNPKLLKGDLDNIIFKAIRKEPERRYKTVEQLSADIWRFIDGVPVTARPSTLTYRAKKFFGRNKIQVIAGVLIILSLLTGISVAIWQANEAREKARIAEEEEERAKKITKFMENIISYANPALNAEGYESDGNARVIDVLNAMDKKIEAEFPNHPDVQSELHHKFSEVYTIRFNRFSKKEDKEKALVHARKSLDLRKQFYGDKHELVAKDMYYLWANRIKSENENQQELARLLAEAIEMMRETNAKNLNLPYMLMDYSSRLWRESDKEVFEIYYQSAIPKAQTDRLELAENYLKESISLLLNHYPQDSRNVIHAKCYLGMLQINMKKINLAQENFAHCSTNKYKESSEHYQLIKKYTKILQEELKK